MATRGFEHFTESDVQRFNRRTQQIAAPQSKYRNVKVTVHGQKFDSQREANHFLALKAREAAGEIRALRCQVPFDLECPIEVRNTGVELQHAVVARYVADFTWRDLQDRLHVADAKGVRTQLYRLKAKWMNLQYGLIIEEV